MAYRKTPRTEARKAANRRRLVEVARKLVAEGGFQDVQIATVAALAGVATGTVYRYFPAKAELCAEVFRSVCEREVAVVEEIATARAPASERLGDAIKVFASRAMRGRRTAYAVVAEPVDPLLDSERLVYRHALAGVFERILRDGIAAGEFAPRNVEVTAACIVGAVMESLVNPLAAGGLPPGQDDEAMLDAIAGFCLRAVASGADGAADGA